MCVSTGRCTSICLICLFLHGWQAQAEDPDLSSKPQFYDDRPLMSENHAEVDKDTEELYLMEKDYFLDKLMHKYGNGMEMPFEGFEHLLHHLGLGGVTKFDHEIRCHKVENSSEFSQLHVHHNHSAEASSSSTGCVHEEEHSHEHIGHDTPDHSHNDDHEHKDTDENHDSIKHEHHDHNEVLDSDGDSHDHVGHSHEHEDHQHNPEDHSKHDNHDHNPEDHSKHDNHDHNPEDHSKHDNHDHNPEDHSKHDNHDHNSEEHEHLHDEKEDKTADNHDEEHNHGDNDEEKDDDHDHGDHDHEHHRQKRHSGQDKCLPANVMLHIAKKDDQPESLTKEMLKEICPSLIYQIDSDACHSTHSQTYMQVDPDSEDDDYGAHTESSAMDLANVPAKVWCFSTIAVIIISLVGLIGVALVPIMQKVFYNHMLQFLVALAVGALSGDALLHLLPHAIAGGHGDGHGGHDHNGGGHSHDTTPIFKGLMGLTGIHFFFFTERALTIFTAYKRKKKQTKNRKKYIRDEETDKVGEKLANSECDGMMMSIHPNKDPLNVAEALSKQYGSDNVVVQADDLDPYWLQNHEAGFLRRLESIQGYADEAHSEHCTISFENTTKISHEHGQRQNCMEETCLNGDENTSMIAVNSAPKPHGHGHGHSHGLDEVPNSVASVAWMLLLGDAIHNVCDGLAIGAAFVNSITGGFSTSVAVFCHELPHEIGDFALLLRAGMSPKQAVLYSALSSIFCFVGMLLGVAIGNMAGATLWIFAIVGGMFLYIALVDMLPELSAVETKKGEHPLCHLLLQGLGVCTGAAILLVIALYEEELVTMLD